MPYFNKPKVWNKYFTDKQNRKNLLIKITIRSLSMSYKVLKILYHPRQCLAKRGSFFACPNVSAASGRPVKGLLSKILIHSTKHKTSNQPPINNKSITYSKQLRFISISIPFYQHFKMEMKRNCMEKDIKSRGWRHEAVVKRIGRGIPEKTRRRRCFGSYISSVL